MPEWDELICFRGFDPNDWPADSCSGFCDFSLVAPLDRVSLYLNSGKHYFYRTNNVVTDEYGIHTIFELDD